jgi:hypothetical protein
MSERGACGVPRKRRRQLMFLVGALLVRKRVPREIVQSVLGSVVHPFTHRRLFMTSLGRSYAWARNLPGGNLDMLPHDVCQELFAAMLLLNFADTDLPAPISTLTSRSDSTPSSVGVVAAKVSRDFAEGLYDFSERTVVTSGSIGRMARRILQLGPRPPCPET